MFYACLFFNFFFAIFWRNISRYYLGEGGYFLLFFITFYANELFEPASLKTCVCIVNIVNTIVYITDLWSNTHCIKYNNKLF